SRRAALLHHSVFDFLAFDLPIPFWVVEHRNAGPDKAQSSRRPTHGAVFLWFCFFCPYKRNELAHEGRKHQINSRKEIKKKRLAVRQHAKGKNLDRGMKTQDNKGLCFEVAK
ncbi:MAG: hypothetical protein ACN4GR_16205, partial [Arenicellales bacterium]